MAATTGDAGTEGLANACGEAAAKPKGETQEGEEQDTEHKQAGPDDERKSAPIDGPAVARGGGSDRRRRGEAGGHGQRISARKRGATCMSAKRMMDR